MKSLIPLTLLILTLAAMCLTALTACKRDSLPPPETSPASAGSPPVQNINREVIIVMPAPDHPHNAGGSPSAPMKKEVSPCR